MAPALFALGIGLRASLIGAVVFAILELLATQHFFVTAIVLAAFAALILIDLARYVARGDRMLERFVEGLAAGELEYPAGSLGGFGRLRGAIERAVTSLNAARLRPQQQIDHLQTLIDTVPVALVTQEESGRVALASRAARLLAGRAIARLEHLGTGAAARLAQLQPGELALRIEQLLRATFDAKGVVYVSRVEPADLVIIADGSLLEQALINLVYNAINAVSGMPRPVVELRCSLRGEQCSISVRDNGRGLESSSVERIFVPFFTTKPEVLRRALSAFVH